MRLHDKKPDLLEVGPGYWQNARLLQSSPGASAPGMMPAMSCQGAAIVAVASKAANVFSASPSPSPYICRDALGLRMVCAGHPKSNSVMTFLSASLSGHPITYPNRFSVSGALYRWPGDGGVLYDNLYEVISRVYQRSKSTGARRRGW